MQYDSRCKPGDAAAAARSGAIEVSVKSATKGTTIAKALFMFVSIQISATNSKKEGPMAMTPSVQFLRIREQVPGEEHLRRGIG